MNKRIREVRKALGLSQDEFGKRLGLTRGAITNIELNKVAPKPLFIDLLCSTFNINREWLETGEGEPFAELTTNEEFAQICAQVVNDDDESAMKVLKSYWGLGENSREIIMNLIDTLTEQEKGAKKE